LVWAALAGPAAAQQSASREIAEGVSGQPRQLAIVDLERPNGEAVEGSVVLSEGGGGGVLVEADLAGLEPGTHRVVVSNATRCPTGPLRSADQAAREGEAEAAARPNDRASAAAQALATEGRTIGEIEVQREGVSSYRLLTHQISLDRKSPESAVGHALVIEKKADGRAGQAADTGEKVCGVIRTSKPTEAPRRAEGKPEAEGPSGPVLSVPRAAEIAQGDDDGKLRRGTTEAPRRAAVARLESASGSPVHGEIVLTEDSEGVLIQADVAGLTPGAHGIHIHETGECTAPDFKSAGDHFAPAREPHGGPVAEAHHAGDLGNLRAGSNGLVQYRIRTDEISLDEGPRSVIGKSVIIHADPDDYHSQPSGDAGAREACGVIRPME
jgi:Cu-Zn family superoxide dismutase